MLSAILTRSYTSSLRSSFYGVLSRPWGKELQRSPLSKKLSLSLGPLPGRCRGGIQKEAESEDAGGPGGVGWSCEDIPEGVGQQAG